MEIKGGPSRNVAHLAGSEIGDAFAVSLSEPKTAAVPWHIDIFVHAEEGRFHLGRVTTTPPSLGDEAARVVAIASFPGAIGWDVEVTPATTGTTPLNTARMFFSTSKCGGGFAGVMDAQFAMAPSHPVVTQIWRLAEAQSRLRLDEHGRLLTSEVPVGACRHEYRARETYAGTTPIDLMTGASSGACLVTDIGFECANDCDLVFSYNGATNAIVHVAKAGVPDRFPLRTPFYVPIGSVFRVTPSAAPGSAIFSFGYQAAIAAP